LDPGGGFVVSLGVDGAQVSSEEKWNFLGGASLQRGGCNFPCGCVGAPRGGLFNVGNLATKRIEVFALLYHESEHGFVLQGCPQASVV